MGRGGTGGRSLLLMAALGTTCLVLSACGGSSAGPSTTRSTPSAPSTPSTPAPATTAATTAVTGSNPSASPGCGSEHAPGTMTETPTFAGRPRTVIVHVPTAYQASSPVALVVNMHGSESTAAGQEGLSGMDATADQDTFIVIYPEGAIAAGAGYEWNVPGQPLFGGSPVPASAPDDVSFITQLVTSMERQYCVDEKRVYATGFSGGARMASQLGCDASGVFAAVAPVSGLRLPTPCPSTRPVPVVSFHGTADPVDPYLGHGQKYWTYSVPTAARRWAVHNGCVVKAQSSHPDTGVLLTTYAPCDAGTEVQLYSIVGEGHEWPGGPTLPKALTGVLGPQTDAISANAVMWSFFEAHPMP